MSLSPLPTLFPTAASASGQIPAILITTNTLDRASSLLREILTSDESFGRCVSILSTGCLFRIVCPLPAAALSHLCWVTMLPRLFLLGCDSGGVGGRRAVFTFAVGCSLSSQMRLQFWPVVHSLYLKTVPCTHKTVPYSSCLVLPCYCLPEWPWVPRFSRLHSDGSMLAHSHLTLSFQPPCFNQNLCSYDTPGPGPISPSPFCLYLIEGFSDILEQLDDSLLKKHHSYYAPKVQWRARAENQQLLCWNL